MSEADFRRKLDDVGLELGQATTRWTARRRRRRQSLALACAAFVVGGAAIAASTELGSNGVEPAAAQVFERAAHADSSRAKPRGGRYFYTETLISARTRTSTAAGQEQTVISTQRTELWAGTDGSGVQVAHPEAIEVPSPPAVPQLGPSGAVPAPTAAPVKSPSRESGRSKVERYRRGTIGPGELGSFDTSFRDSLLDQFGLSARGLERLSSSQSAFNDRLLAATKSVVRRLKPSGPDQQAIDRQAFFLVAGMLGQWGEPMPVPLRRALYRFAATLGGISVDEDFRDESGEAGIALRSGGTQVVLAPKTYRLRATSYRAGNTETTIATVRTAIVDRPRARPKE